MTTLRRRLTRRAAEKILDHHGDPTEPLARLVDAAATPAGPDLGEERAVALFGEATILGPVPISESDSVMKRLSRKIAALPAAALVAGGLLVGGGGLALAASQGAVHVPFTGHDNRSSHAPAAPASTNPGLTRTPAAPDSSAPATHLPSASPSPSLRGLCVAFQAGADPRKATNPAFAALRTAAGSADGVAAYCTNLLGSGPKPPHPTQAASPTIPPHPTQAASPTIPPRPSQAVSPTIPPHPTRAAH